MQDNFRSFPLAVRLLFKDPINFILMLIPTALAVLIYLVVVALIFKNSDAFVYYLGDHIHSPETRGYVGRILTALLIIFIFLLMSWTFVIVVGIVAAPFNSMLSARIEKLLIGKSIDEDRKKTFHEMLFNLKYTFVNEVKKLLFVLILTVFAFFMNMIPVIYPLGLCLMALLMSIQFIDYSWSRHEQDLGACLKDLFKNFFPYLFSGFFFLLLMTVPIINAIVPALATSYFTVLWLHRQKKIPMTPPSQM